MLPRVMLGDETYNLAGAARGPRNLAGEGVSLFVPELARLLRRFALVVGLELESLARRLRSTVGGEEHKIMPIMGTGDDSHLVRGAGRFADKAARAFALSSNFENYISLRGVAHLGAVKGARKGAQFCGHFDSEDLNRAARFALVGRVEGENEGELLFAKVVVYVALGVFRDAHVLLTTAAGNLPKVCFFCLCLVPFIEQDAGEPPYLTRKMFFLFFGKIAGVYRL